MILHAGADELSALRGMKAAREAERALSVAEQHAAREKAQLLSGHYPINPFRIRGQNDSTEDSRFRWIHAFPRALRDSATPFGWSAEERGGGRGKEGRRMLVQAGKGRAPITHVSASTLRMHSHTLCLRGGLNAWRLQARPGNRSALQHAFR